MNYCPFTLEFYQTNQFDTSSTTYESKKRKFPGPEPESVASPEKRAKVEPSNKGFDLLSSGKFGVWASDDKPTEDNLQKVLDRAKDEHNRSDWACIYKAILGARAREIVNSLEVCNKEQLGRI